MTKMMSKVNVCTISKGANSYDKVLLPVETSKAEVLLVLGTTACLEVKAIFCGNYCDAF